MCVPFTLRGFPETLSKLQVNNDFACIPFWIRFPKDKQTNERIQIFEPSDDKKMKPASFIKETAVNMMSELKATMRTKRSKFESVGWYYMMKFFLFLLRYPLNYQPTGVASYYHSVLSLVPGPKEKFKFGTPDR